MDNYDYAAIRSNSLQVLQTVIAIYVKVICTRGEIYFDCSRAGAGIFAPAYTGKGCLQEQSNDLIDKHDALRNFLKDQVNVKEETNIVLEAVGLEFVDGLDQLKQLKRKLKIGVYPDSKILSYDQHELIKLALQ